MTPLLTLTIVGLTAALIVSTALIYFQKRKINRTIQLLHQKDQLAIKINDILLWEYDVTKHLFYSISEKSGNTSITPDDYYQVTHPDDLQMVCDIIALMESQRNETFEFDVRFKFPTDNDWQYIKINGTPLKTDSNGNVVKYTGFQRNNTSWHNIIKTLRTKDEMNKMILDNMRAGLVYLSPSHKVIWENTSKKFSLNFRNGRNLFEVGKYCHDTHMGITQLCASCMLENISKEKKSMIAERTLDNGNILEVIGNAIIDKKGNYTGIILRVDDITERKQLYKELEVSRNEVLASNQLLYEILNRIPGALFIKDQNDDFRYVVANKIFCKTLGKTEEEIIGKTDFEIMDYETASAFRRDDKQAITSPDPIIIEEKTHFHGKSHYWKTSKASFTTVNNQQLLIAMSVDISEISRTNSELQKAKEKAEESDKLKSAFLANMSHEIRTPLNAIVGFSELLKTCEDPEEKEEYIHIISTNNDLLLRLINDILDLSKLESGIIQLNSTTFDLAEFFEELAPIAQQRITNPEIQFITQNPYKSCIIETDKDRMVQVWFNYITNAAKYTPSGQIIMGYEYINDGIKIYVKDTGIGISEEKKGKLFHRFEKLDSFAQGTGLGLSICKAIAELEGGKVGVESTEGEGSLFWAWKPMKAKIDEKKEFKKISVTPPEHEPKMPDIESQFKGQNVRILVAEDNDSNYTLIHHILRSYFQVTRVVNGLEAVEFVKNNPVDLLLMDIKMPVMDGLQATRRIREFNSDLPIIALTANAFDYNLNEAIDSGCNDWITKPVRKKELFTVLTRMCKNKHLLGQSHSGKESKENK